MKKKNIDLEIINWIFELCLMRGYCAHEMYPEYYNNLIEYLKEKAGLK